MVGSDFDTVLDNIKELISDLDGTPYEATVKCLKEQQEAIIKLRAEASDLETLLDEKTAEQQNLSKSKFANEEHKLVSDRLRQLLGWERG